MNRIFINKLDKEFELELCKVNKTPICTIDSKFVDSITRSLNDMDKINLTIPKMIKDGYMNDIINPLWDEIKDERLICLNNRDYFVIKTNTFGTDDNKKSITAHSREYKLGKIDIIVEDIAFMLMGEDEENGIYSLNEYMALESVSEARGDILDFFLQLTFSYRIKIFAIYRKILDIKSHKIFT